MSTRILVTFLVAASLLNLNACYETVEGSTMSEEFDPSDPHWDVKQDAASPSGGVSAGVDLVTGQETPSTGPQAWFKDENGTPLAKTYTVRFGVTPPSMGVTTSDNLFDCLATVTSTVQGNSVTRILNVGQAVAISGEAESVTVSLQDITPDQGQNVNQPGGGTATFGNPYRVSVLIAPGIRPNYTIPPTLEAFTDTVDGLPSVQSGAIFVTSAHTVTYPIPPNAGISSVQIVTRLTALALGNGSRILATLGTGTANAKQWDPTEQTGFMVIPPNSTQLTVENGTGGFAFVTVTWGIEG